MSRGNQSDGHGAAPKGALTGHIDDWEAVAVDYLDGRLDQKTKVAVDLHLRDCPACAARLQMQEAVLSLLDDTPLTEPPAGLEDRVLDEVLFPSPVKRPAAHPRTKEASGWSTFWRRRARPYIPVAVGVAAVFLAIIGYGIFSSQGGFGGGSEATTTSAAARQTTYAADSTAKGGAESTLSAAAPTSTAAAAATTTTAAGASTTAGATTTGASAAMPSSTTAGMTTTTATMATTGANGSGTDNPPAAPTEDKKQMVTTLKEAGTQTAYFVFEAQAPQDEVSAEMRSVADQIVSQTELEPVSASISPEGTTFAAYMPKMYAQQLVDLLQAIRFSASLRLTLGEQPPASAGDLYSRLMGNRGSFPGGDLPKLYARKTPQPAVSQWQFTTSTLPPGSTPTTGAYAPQTEADQLLVFIFIPN